MGLELPTDHASGDVWGTRVNAAFGLVGSHNHTIGQGVRVPPGGLNMNANLSFSPAGTPSAVTDLLAVDFSAVAASAVASLSGALFVNSADSELYWRNTSGTNVKLTSGSSINVSAVGGIGGDYAAVNALEVFDDSTDSYWFQQQIGAGVRQYARMRCADVDLYEFKANPTGVVPTNRVRIASPTGLAASYALTLPGSLPTAATSKIVAIDSTGLIGFTPASLPVTTDRPLYMSTAGTVTAGQPSRTYSWGVAGAQVGGSFSYSGGAITIAGVNCATLMAVAQSAGSSTVNFSLNGLETGIRITSFSFIVDTGTYGAVLYKANASEHASGTAIQTSGSVVIVGYTNSPVTLSVPETVTAGNVYMLAVNNTTTTGKVYGCSITYDIQL